MGVIQDRQMREGSGESKRVNANDNIAPVDYALAA